MKNDIIYIRVFATLLVVLGHSWLYNGFSGFTEADIPGAMTGTWLYGLNHFIYTFHMPLFFAVSGYLVALSVRRKGQIAVRSWLRKKAFRLLLPFFVVTLFYCLPIKWVAGLFDGETMGNVLWGQFVKADGAHTWFMLALFWCMLIGLLVALTDLRHKRCFWPLLLLLLGVHLIGIPRFAEVVDVFCLDKGLRFSIYFLFGYLLERRITITPPLLALSTVAFIVLECYLLGFPHEAHGFVQAKLLVILKDLVGLSAIVAAFGFAARLAAQFSPGNAVLSLDKRSFEIYLYSEPLNYLILAACAHCGGWPFDSSLLYWLRFFLTLFGALLISHLIKINYGQK